MGSVEVQPNPILSVLVLKSYSPLENDLLLPPTLLWNTQHTIQMHYDVLVCSSVAGRGLVYKSYSRLSQKFSGLLVHVLTVSMRTSLTTKIGMEGDICNA